MITGESIPVEKVSGAKVVGGTVNQTGSFIMRAEKLGSETLLAQIVRMVAEAQRSRAPIPLRFDFVPTVRTLIQLFFTVESHRSSCGKSFTQFTTTSRSPSLSKSPKAQPREAEGADIPRPAFSETYSNRPLRKFLYSNFRCA